MARITRDEVIRRLWLAGFAYSHDVPTAQCFTRSSDRAEVLVPKREQLGDRWALMPIQPAEVPNASPCCNVPSKLRLIYAGVVIYRCSACLSLWERPFQRRPHLRIVK